MNLAHKFDIIEYLNPEKFCKLTGEESYAVDKGGECHRSSSGIAEVLNKFNMKQINFNPDLETTSAKEIDEAIKSINNKNFNTLRVSTGPHQFFIEVNGNSIRILSLWGSRHGFYDYSKMSKFGKYFEIDGDTYNEMIGYFNDIIEFKPRNEGQKNWSEMPVFKNANGEQKMRKAVNAWIELFGVSTNNSYTKDNNYLEMEFRYVQQMRYKDEALGYSDWEKDGDTYLQLRIRNHREYIVPKKEYADDEGKFVGDERTGKGSNLYSESLPKPKSLPANTKLVLMDPKDICKKCGQGDLRGLKRGIMRKMGVVEKGICLKCHEKSKKKGGRKTRKRKTRRRKSRKKRKKTKRKKRRRRRKTRRR
tara:strand:- start:2134 stop:3222 length:1089 start_codon:yes stop_codon:yes gene_type:complete